METWPSIVRLINDHIRLIKNTIDLRLVRNCLTFIIRVKYFKLTVICNLIGSSKCTLLVPGLNLREEWQGLAVEWWVFKREQL